MTIKRKISNGLLFLSGVSLLCVFVFSCDFELFQNDLNSIASVGNRNLYVDELRDVALDREFSKEERILFIENWIDIEVLYQEALNRGFQKDKETQRMIKNAEKKILADKMLMELVKNIPNVTYEDERNFYDSNMDLFRDDTVLIEFPVVKEKIKRILTIEKIKQEQNEHLQKIKNNYNIKIYKEYMDSL